MAKSITQALDTVHPRMAAMRGESVRRNPADVEDRRAQGAEIDAALKFAKLTRQEAAYAMGYADDYTINRWISGAENPNFVKLRTLGALFRRGLLIAQAASIGVGVRVETVVTIVGEVEGAA